MTHTDEQLWAREWRRAQNIKNWRASLTLVSANKRRGDMPPPLALVAPRRTLISKKVKAHEH